MRARMRRAVWPVDLEADVRERVDFEKLLAESDVLSIHIHLSEENRSLIDAAYALARMKARRGGHQHQSRGDH